MYGLRFRVGALEGRMPQSGRGLNAVAGRQPSTNAELRGTKVWFSISQPHAPEGFFRCHKYVVDEGHCRQPCAGIQEASI